MVYHVSSFQFCFVCVFLSEVFGILIISVWLLGWYSGWYHGSVVPVLQLFRMTSEYSASQEKSNVTNYFSVFGPRISSETDIACVPFESWLHFSQLWLDFRFYFQCYVKMRPFFNPHPLLDLRLKGFNKTSPTIVNS